MNPAEPALKEAEDTLKAMNPQRRFIEPAEVAVAVNWLCLPGSEGVTGEATEPGARELLDEVLQETLAVASDSDPLRAEELDKLIAIRHLQEQGKRPGKLMTLDLSQLRSMMRAPEIQWDGERLIALLQSNATAELRDWLHKQLVTLGLRTFIHRVMAPATRAVGKAWEEGRLQVHQEHLYTELVKGLIRQALVEVYREGGKPRIMLIQGEVSRPKSMSRSMQLLFLPSWRRSRCYAMAGSIGPGHCYRPESGSTSCWHRPLHRSCSCWPCFRR